MDRAMDKYGIDYATFVANGMFILNERRWKSAKVQYNRKINASINALEAAGLTKKDAEKVIKRIRKKTSYKLSLNEYVAYEIYNMSFKDARKFAKLLHRSNELKYKIRQALDEYFLGENVNEEYNVDSKAFSKDVEELYKISALTITKEYREKYSGISSSEKEIIDMNVSFKLFQTTGMEYKLYHFDEISLLERTKFLANNVKNDTLRALPQGKERDLYRKFCDMTDSKIKTYRAFKEFYRRECIVVKSKSDYEEFVKFAQNHPRFIKKPLTASQGKGVELFESNGNLEKLFKEVRTRNKVILEEVISQNEIVAQFNKDSINTFRIITFNDGKNVEPVWGYFRTGRAGSIVDNAGAGGILASIDCKKGIVCSDGGDERGNRYEVHPETGLKYKGFEIPNWEDLKNISITLSSGFPEAAVIGWDFAFNDKGEWVIVEVNCMPEFLFQGAADLGVRKEFMDLIAKRKQNIEEHNDGNLIEVGTPIKV